MCSHWSESATASAAVANSARGEAIAGIFDPPAEVDDVAHELHGVHLLFVGLAIEERREPRQVLGVEMRRDRNVLHRGVELVPDLGVDRGEQAVAAEALRRRDDLPFTFAGGHEMGSFRSPF